MKDSNTRRGSMSGVFVFMLLGVFALISTLMVLLSAQAYRSTTDRTARANAQRVLTSFVRSSLMSDDEAELLEVREEEGLQTLCVVTGEGEDCYIKRLYCSDGYLRELYTFNDYKFDPEEGETLCRASAMRVTHQDGLLTVYLTDESGVENALHFAPRTEQNGI